MIILVLEDKKEEQVKAKEAVMKLGGKIVIAETLEGAHQMMDKLGKLITGILTDMHFPEKDGSKDSNPNGLAVVMWAIQRKIPVSICSDVDHHHARYLQVVVGGLRELTEQKIPFTLDCKNWANALDNLEKFENTKEKEGE